VSDVSYISDMSETSAIAEAPKLNRTISFRIAPELRQNLDTLATDTDRDISDIIRDGLVAFWPEIEALNRQLGRRATPEAVARLRAYIDAGQQAAALGLDLPALLAREAAAAAAARAEVAA
jgi:predicted DNA-binding protein